MDHTAEQPAVPVPTPPPMARVSAGVDGIRVIPFPPWAPPADTRRAVFIAALWAASFLFAEFIQALVLRDSSAVLGELPVWRAMLALAPWCAALLWATYAGAAYGGAMLVAASLLPSVVLPVGGWFAGPLAIALYSGLIRAFGVHPGVRNWRSAGVVLFAAFCGSACYALLSRKLGTHEMLLSWERNWIFLFLNCLCVTLPVLVILGPRFEQWKASIYGPLETPVYGTRGKLLWLVGGTAVVAAFSLMWVLSIELESNMALDAHLNHFISGVELDAVLHNAAYKRLFLVAMLAATICGGAALTLLNVRRLRKQLGAESARSVELDVRWQEQLAALAAAGEAVEQLSGGEAQFQQALQRLVAVTDAARAAVYLPDPDSPAHLLLQEAQPAQSMPERISRKRDALAEQALTTGLVAHEDSSAEADSESSGEGSGTLARYCVPMLAESQPLGLIVFEIDAAGHLDPRDLALLQLAGNMLGAALNRRDSQLKARQYAGDLSGLYRFSQQLLAENSDSGIFAVSAPAARALLNASCAAVFAVRQEKGRQSVACVAADGPPSRTALFRELSFPVDDPGAIAVAIREQRTFDTGRRDAGAPPLALVSAWNESCAIVAPLPATGGEGARGVLVMAFDEPRDLALEESGLAQEIARQVSAALRRVDLVSTTSRQASELRAIDQLGRAVSQRMEISYALNETIQHAARLVHAAWANIFMLDADNAVLRTRATNMTNPDAATITIPLDEHSIVGASLKSGQTLVSNDMASDPRCNPDRNRQFKTRACVCVPLAVPGRRFGVLMVSDPEPASFGASEVRLLEQIGQIVSAAMERARLFEEACSRTDELILLNEIGHLLVENPILEDTLRRIAERLLRNMDADGLAFYLPSDTGDVLLLRGSATRAGDSPESARIEMNANDLAVSVYHSRQPISLCPPDGEPLRFAPAAGARALAIIPLQQNERATGVLAAWRMQSSPFKPQDIQRLTHVARLAGSAIARETLGRALRASEVLLQEVVDGIEAMLISVDREGNIQSFNATAERLSGAARKDVLGRQLGRVICSSQHDQQRLYHFIANAFETGDSAERMEFLWLPRAGGERRIRWSASFLHGAGGRPSGLIFLGIDVTGQTELETQLRQAQKMESVGTLAGGMAHDFNNLLGGILGQCTLLRVQNEGDDALAGGLARIEAAAQRGADLTAKLMAFARKSVLQPRRVDMGALLVETADLLTGSLPSRIQVFRRFAPLLPPVFGDPTQLQQVLLNLCVNARDAMPDGGSLTIAASHIADPQYGEGAGGVLIEVSDTGTGMAPDVRQRLFEPFFTTKAPGKGTGLGLSVVFGIVRSHGGEISCESQPGNGTRFTMRLPAMPRGVSSGLYRATPSPSFSSPALPAQQQRAPNTAALSGSEAVLLIDDDVIVRETVEALLGSLGYSVHAAPDGLSALCTLDEQDLSPAIIVLDVVMPGLSGQPLFRELNKRLPNTPVILISGYSLDQTVQDLLAAGARELVQKPFSLETIASTLRRHLGATASAT
jgi:PAS domain S-box-containing protein